MGTGRDDGGAKVADDELRAEVATETGDDGVVTLLPSTALGGGVIDEELRGRAGVGDGAPGTLDGPLGASVGSTEVLDEGSTERAAVATVVLVARVAAGTDGAEESEGSSLDTSIVVRDDDGGSASLLAGSCLLSPTWLRSAAFAAAAAPETMTTLQIVATINSFRREGMQ